MTRAQFEAVVWQHWPTRDPQAVSAVAAILAAAESYATHTRKHKPRPKPARTWYVHTGDTDLYPVIAALADALMPSSEQEAAA